MKTMTLGKRIALGFAIILTLFSGVAATSYILLRDVKKQLALVTGDALPGIASAGQIKSNAAEIQLAVLRHMLAKSPEEKKTFEERIDVLKQNNEQALADYEKTITNEGDRDLFKQLGDARRDYIKARGPGSGSEPGGEDGGSNGPEQDVFETGVQ